MTNIEIQKEIVNMLFADNNNELERIYYCLKACLQETTPLRSRVAPKPSPTPVNKKVIDQTEMSSKDRAIYQFIESYCKKHQTSETTLYHCLDNHVLPMNASFAEEVIKELLHRMKHQQNNEPVMNGEPEGNSMENSTSKLKWPKTKNKTSGPKPKR